MKRLFALITVALMSAGIAIAQDYNAAIEVFNSAAVALQNENKTEALSLFKQALPLFEACGEEGAEMVAKCKEQIPIVTLSVAKDLINDKEYDKAIETLKEAEKIAKEYGAAEVVTEVGELVPNALFRKAETLRQAKDFAGAAAVFQEVIALEPKNGQAFLLLGQSLMNAGKTDEAIEALKNAAANGKEEMANKLIGNIYLKQGQALLKGGKALEAAETIQNALNYMENAGAYKLLASAWMKGGKTANAINAYKKYVEVAPDAKDVPDILFTIAATAHKAGDKATAIEYYSKLTGNAKYGEQAKTLLASLKK